jgi:diaminopimelate decarboxylase
VKTAFSGSRSGHERLEQVSDQLVESVALRQPAVGDVIAVPVTGAYCLTMANNYNGALRPPVVLARDGEDREVLRRETYDGLLRRDVAWD